MTNRNKAVGTAAESAVVKTLIEAGWVHAERRALAGSLDRGDISGIPGLCFEIKSAKSLNWPEWLAETATETQNANADYGFLWAKRPRKSDPLDWYVMMTGRDLIRILKQLGY